MTPSYIGHTVVTVRYYRFGQIPWYIVDNETGRMSAYYSFFSDTVTRPTGDSVVQVEFRMNKSRVLTVLSYRTNLQVEGMIGQGSASYHPLDSKYGEEY